ncbi:HAD family hydrolase [Nocardia uniformis]|uniref:HAD family hydrolase n=1 Tax=Nocardia uniformis TaxID=53432 RepID=A0A849CGI2_9NOCA|nr:HAD family hydrolase [Nocardia uniformis]
MVGFDLDMTLADTRAGIGACYARIAAETGVFIDVDLVTSRLGPPLEMEMANWFPADRVDAVVERYRELYPDIAVPASKAMPGAREAVEAVRVAGGRTMVVSAKNHRDTVATVEFLELPVDVIQGGLWAAAKGSALREHAATVYVGDHPGDVDAARAADAFSLAVATGGFSADTLRDYGADEVLSDLACFPTWLRDNPIQPPSSPSIDATATASSAKTTTSTTSPRDSDR